MLSLLKHWRVAFLIRLNPTRITYGRGFTFGRGTTFNAPNGIDIGQNVYVGKYCSLETDLEIGDNVLLGNLVGLIGRYDHDYSVVGKSIKDSPWIGDADYAGPGRGQRLVIESDCWIGFGAVVLSGVRVGRGSIIAAGAVVTKDVPPYSIVAGVPARVVSARFTDAEIERHEAILYGERT